MVLLQANTLCFGSTETITDGSALISLGLSTQVAQKSYVVQVISDRGISGDSILMSFRVLLNNRLVSKENKPFWRKFRLVCETGVRTLRAMSSTGTKIYYTPKAPLDNFSSSVLKMVREGKVEVTQDTYEKAQAVTDLLQDVQKGKVKLVPPPKPKSTPVSLRRNGTPISLKKIGIG